MRFITQGIIRDSEGKIVSGATISVYLAGTTTAASIYIASTGGTAVNSVTSASNGSFYFYVDDSDYARTQLFKIITSNGSRFDSETWDNMLIMDTSTIVANVVLNLGAGVIGNIPSFDAVTGKSVEDSGISITSVSLAISKSHTQGADTTLGVMAADVDMDTHKLKNLKVPTTAGDSIRATAKITEALLESATDIKHIQGSDTGTTSNSFNIGDGAGVTDKHIVANNADENKPYLGYDEATNSWVFSNDGSAETQMVGAGAADIDVLMDNIVILGWQLAIHSGLTIFNLEDGVVDEFEDESGIDTTDSLNEAYDSSGDYYSPSLITYTPTVATSDMGYSGTNPIAKCYDGDWSTAWDCADGVDFLGKYIRFDLGSSYLCNTLKIKVLYTGTTEWDIYGSADDSNWDLLSDNLPLATTAGTVHEFLFSNLVSYRYYKMICRTSVSGSVFDIYEVAWCCRNNMTLISESKEANTQPTKARFLALVEPVDAITINTDLLAYISEDDQAHWDQVTLADEGYFDATKKIYAGNVNLTSYSDKTMRQKLVTANNKNLKVHAWAMMWGV